MKKTWLQQANVFATIQLPQAQYSLPQLTKIIKGRPQVTGIKMLFLKRMNNTGKMLQVSSFQT